MKKEDKIPSIQALRGIAFLFVFLCHSGLVWENFGGFGVSIFFVLSGYLLSSRYRETSSPSLKSMYVFTRNRIKKLYPLHVFMLTVGLIMSFLICFLSKTQYSLKTNLLYYACDLLLIQSWIPIRAFYYSINGVSWFLSSISFLYFIFPLVISVLKKKSSLFLLILLFTIPIQQFLFAYIFKILLPNQYLWFTGCFPVFRVFDFCAGIVVGLLDYRNQFPIISKKTATFCEIVVGCVVVFVIWLCGRTVDNQIIAIFLCPAILFLPISSLVIVLFRMKKGLITTLLSCRVFVFMGNISGTAFLAHQLMIQYVKLVLSKLFALHGVLLLIASGLGAMLITVLFSYCWIWYFQKKETRKNANSTY